MPYEAKGEEGRGREKIDFADFLEICADIESGLRLSATGGSPRGRGKWKGGAFSRSFIHCLLINTAVTVTGIRSRPSRRGRRNCPAIWQCFGEPLVRELTADINILHYLIIDYKSLEWSNHD